jgi:hypothetical protein
MTDDKDLDLMFAAARESRPVPSAGLMARVLADAYDAQPLPAAPARSATPHQELPRQNPLLQALAAFTQVLGGKGALAGLGTAAVAGVWLGYSGTTGLDWVTTVLLSGGLGEVEMIAADDLFLSEG